MAPGQAGLIKMMFTCYGMLVSIRFLSIIQMFPHKYIYTSRSIKKEAFSPLGATVFFSAGRPSRPKDCQVNYSSSIFTNTCEPKKYLKVTGV